MKGVPNVFPNGYAKMEIRKLMDAEDFGEGFTPKDTRHCVNSLSIRLAPTHE